METVPPGEIQTEIQKFSRSDLWRFQLLGGLRAVWGETTLEKFQTQKTASLLAYLAFYSHRRHTREDLIDLLWPEAEPERALLSSR